MRRSQTVEELSALGKLAPAAPSSTRSTMLTTESLGEALEDWLYWQRDANDAHCWTKVYGVLENEFLWLFKGYKSPKTLFMQIAVASVEESGERQLRLVDPNGLDMEIWLLDKDAFRAWRHRLQDAATLTAEFFRASELEVEQLPRKSAYRGSLVAYRRSSSRAHCRAAIEWLATTWRRKLLPPASR